MTTLMKYRWTFATMVMATLLLSACSAKGDMTNPAESLKSVALIFQSSQGDYWKTVRMGAEAAAKEFNLQISITSPERGEDINGQLELVHQAIKDGADGLVLAANDFDFEGFTEIAELAASKHISVITIDSEADSPQAKGYIGINNYEAGQKAAKKLMELVGERGRIAVMSFDKGTKNTRQREAGLLEELAKYPQVQLADKEYCDTDSVHCEGLAEKLLGMDQPIDGLVALNAISSIGAASTIHRMGLAGKVKVVTFDNTPENIGFLQDGVIQATIIQNPFIMGYLGVKHVAQAIDGHKIPEFIDTGTKVIDQENMFWLDNQKLLFPFVQ
ncbi:substrate-binding domain-containing protein [Paenibacillus agricola]|uniref:Substrate-binding domain-containing protein n=1 Tax=Paenibacillus agricola TaxID=2716264 RepID=A0ABX0J0C2_9BACL|nr:substrate-binding domain-containing protein [Paenibacillus agricola]NHN29133.1 substrate-binding domain-containing protein [Paenibacillus agricola]